MVPRLAMKPFDFLSGAFDISIGLTKTLSKAGLVLVFLVTLYHYHSGIPGIPGIPGYSLKEPPKTFEQKYYDKIFARIHAVKANVDDFDVDSLLQESKSWSKTFKKIKKVVAIPISLVTSAWSYFSRNKNGSIKGDDIADEEGSTTIANSFVASVIAQLEQQDPVDFELTDEDLSELNKFMHSDDDY